MNVVKGSIVRSTAGRDRNTYYVAVEVSDRWIMLCDGRYRKLGAPKRKNPRHISPTAKVLRLEGMTDKQLRKQLAAFPTQNAGGNHDLMMDETER